MPFLFRSLDHFIIVDEKPRQGIFYQIYNKEGFSRPSLIHTGSSLNYSVTVDPSNTLHVVVEGNNHQVTYYVLSPTHTSKRIVLEDPRTTYLFENLSIHWLDNEPHLFYTVVHPNGLNRSLVHQTLNSNTPKIKNLLTNLPLRTTLTYYVLDATLYILYPSYEESYCLNMLTFTPSHHEATTLVHSSIPIVEWNICQHEKTLYILYKTDQYGHATYHLINLNTGEDTLVPLPETSITPVLLSFLNNLWIHYKDYNKYYTLLVLPWSKHFSTPILSHLQNHISVYTYASIYSNDFEASCLYASLSHTLRLLTIAELDINGIHPDLTPKEELALFIEGMHFHQIQTPPHSQTPYSPPVTPSTLTQKSIETTSPVPPQPSSAKKDLKSLTEAFMNMGTTF